uniref:Calcineurin-like phosphoesterase domain-containing protein n=1 Tax=Desulfobacca acetoxidans TaxID=60893 RepID=A0A7V4GAC3_9BACT
MNPAATDPARAIDIDRSVGDFHYPEDYKLDAGYGLSERTVHFIADAKGEPDWIREFRLRALGVFESKPMPTHWASDDLNTIDFSKIRYYLSKGDLPRRSWDEVPEDVKRTFERLGIPEQERKFLAGVEAQVIVTGHTHIPQMRRVEERWLINPGSVGFPKDGDPRAAYALLELGQGLHCTIRRVAYPWKKTAAGIIAAGLPAQAAEDLRYGRRLRRSE